MVVFGANANHGPGDDTWELDLASGTWVRREPAGAIPPPRYRHGMAYDARRGKVLLYGGTGQLGVLLDDVWEWDGAQWAGPFRRPP